MKNIFKYIACVGLLGVGLASCGEEEGITPASVTNLRYESTPGKIKLLWDVPGESNIRYVQVNFYDPLQKLDVMKTASAYADGLEIGETRQKYGEYKFTVRSVSETGDKSEEQILTAVSQPKEQTWTPTALALTADMLSTNAQETVEGPIANLLDNNKSTYFHTAYNFSVDGYHWMQVALPITMDGWWQFEYSPRTQNSNNKPTDFDIEGSMDGSTWFLIKNFTKEADNLPTDNSTSFLSERLDASERPFKYMKMTVKATNNGTVFWTMSEFKIYTVALIDPEAPDEE